MRKRRFPRTVIFSKRGDDMAIFNDDVKTQLRNALESMKKQVNVIFFTQKLECGICADTHEFLKEFTSLTDKLSLSAFDYIEERDKAAYYRIERVPCIALLDDNDEDTRIRFYGIPAGYEINSFMRAIFEVSGVRSDIPSEILTRMKNITRPVHIEVFVSLTCPYCPDAVSMAHRFALENTYVRADMIDASVFTPLAIRHNVNGVPKTIVNGKTALEGLSTLNSLVEAVENSRTT